MPAQDLVHYPLVVRNLEVLRVTDITPRMRRVTLGGSEITSFTRDGHEQAAFLTGAPDDHVKLFFTAPGESTPVLPVRMEGQLSMETRGARPIARNYTVRRFDPVSQQIDLDFVRHGAGAAGTWVEHVRPGDRLHVAGPRASYVRPPSIDWYLLMGDETALPAIGRWLEELPPEAHAVVIVEVESPDEEQTLASRATVDVRWLHRSGASSSPTRLVDAAQGITPPSPATAYAWAGAELSLVQPLRQFFLQDLGLAPERVQVASYWTRGEAEHANEVEERRRAHRLQNMASLLTPWAIRVAATLRIPDLVESGARTREALALRAEAHPQALGRLVDYLLELDVLNETGGELSVGALGQALLDTDHEELRSHLDLHSATAHLEQAFAGLAHSIATGEPGYPAVFGQDVWTTFGTNNALARSYNQQRAKDVLDWVPALITDRDWSAVRHVVDIGGGPGSLLLSLLQQHTHLQGTLIDVPAIAVDTREHVAEMEIADRCTVVAGDLFEPPAGSDLYVLGQVLRNWRDDEATRLLQRCRDAAGPEGRVLIIEQLSEAGGRRSHHDDLLTLVLFGSHIRTRAELESLSHAAGLDVTDVRPLGHGYLAMECQAMR